MTDMTNALLLPGGDWRAIAGLTRDDAGSLVERVLARVVHQQAVAIHNKQVK